MTSTFLNRVILLVLFIMLPFVGKTQESGCEIGVQAGFLKYNRVNPATGMFFRYAVTSRWSLKTSLLWAEIIDTGVHTEFAFFERKERKITPYLLAGTGITLVPHKQTNCGIYALLGAGATYKMAHGITVGCELSFRAGIPLTGKQNSKIKDKRNYSWLLFSVSRDLPFRSRKCNKESNNSN